MKSLELLKTLNIDLTNGEMLDRGFKVMERDIKRLRVELCCKS